MHVVELQNFYPRIPYGMRLIIYQLAKAYRHFYPRIPYGMRPLHIVFIVHVHTTFSAFLSQFNNGASFRIENNQNPVRTSPRINVGL